VAQEARDQVQAVVDLEDTGATPEEIQEAMDEVIKMAGGNQFW
jgi:alkylhydroperoxidase/carboxymuconolactone decarboxylase family protein YurZ